MDDWESMLEKDEEVIVTKQFDDEEFAVKKDEPQLTQTTNQTSEPVKKKKNITKQLKTGEIDKKFHAQNNAVNETFGMADPKRKGELLAYQAKLEAQKLAEESDQKLTEELFRDVVQKKNVCVGTVELKSKSDFQFLGKRVAEIMNQQERKSYVEAFVIEILSSLAQKLSSKELQDIQDVSKKILNQKILEDKQKDLGKKKATKGPVLKQNKAVSVTKDYDDDDYGDDDDDYEADEYTAQYLKE